MKKSLQEITAFRHTVKAYDPTRKVPEDQWKEIVEFMRWAPHSMNQQTIRIIAVDHGTELQKEFTKPDTSLNNTNLFADVPKIVFFISSADGTKFDPSNPVFVEGVKYGAFQRAGKVADVKEEAMPQAEKNIMSFASSMGFSDYGTWSKRQAYIPLGYMQVAAANFGLDTTPMEGFSPTKMKEIFMKHGLMTEKEDVVLMQALGYRLSDTAFNKSERKSLDWYLTEVK